MELMTIVIDNYVWTLVGNFGLTGLDVNRRNRLFKQVIVSIK